MKGAGPKLAVLAVLVVAAVSFVPGSSGSSTALSLTYPSTGACAKTSTGLNDCIASATDGSTITIKPGTYMEHGTVVDHSVTITGSCGNPLSTVIDQGVAGDGFDIAANNVTIECLTVRHGGSSYYGIHNTSFNNLHVMKVDAFEEEYGLYQATSGTSGLSVVNSTFLGMDEYAVYSNNTTGATVTGDTFGNTSSYCAYFSSLSGSTFSNNNVGPCDSYGLYIGGGANNTVAMNKMHSNESSCMELYSHATTVTKNTFTGCSGEAVYIDANYPTITNNLVNGNVDGYTFEVSCGDNANVSGNVSTVGNDDEPFIYVCQNNSGSETITNNVDSGGNVSYGIECSTCDAATVTGNKISGGGNDYGIYVYGHRPVVNANAVSGGWNDPGIFVNCTASCYQAQVEKNVESGSYADYGFELENDGCSSATPCMTISGNTATDNYEDGFYLVTEGALIVGNTATHNGYSYTGCNSSYSGFDIEWDSNTLTKNIATANACDGFYVNSATNILSGNTAAGNFVHGFQVESTFNALDTNIATGNMGDGFNNDGTDTSFTSNKASGNRQDCTSDTTGGETATIDTNTGNTCADATDFGVTSLLTGW